MNISNAGVTSLGAIVNSPQPQPVIPKNDKPVEKEEGSTIVKLSAQAQRMDRGNAQDNKIGPDEGLSQENTEPSGIEFMQGEKKGGRINTFA